MLIIFCAGCAATGKAIIRATGKKINTSELLPSKNISTPQREAFPLQFGQVTYKGNPAGEVGTYQVVSGVIRDIVLDDNPGPVLEKLIQQEFTGKGIKNQSSILTLNGTVTALSVNGDRSTPQTFSGSVSIDLIINNVKTGEQVWARNYLGMGYENEPQVALASAFQNMAGAISTDDSILDLKDIFIAAGDIKQSNKKISSKEASNAAIPTPLPKNQTTQDLKSNSIPPTITITSPEVKRGVKVVSRLSSLKVIGNATAVNGIALLTVNGEEIAFDKKGNFTSDVLLKLGENQIAITAMDVRRNRTTEQFTIVREGESVTKPAKEEPFISSTEGVRYIALIIGINNYRNLARLSTAVNDAETVARVLKAGYGFETTLILNEQATRDDIMKELNALRKKLTSKDRLLIYYAGHGDYNRETDTAYWMPVDADRDDNTNWIESKTISDQLKLITARHILVVSDSCYSGTLTRTASANLSGNDTRSIYLRKLDEKPSRILIASGGNEPVSDSGGTGHSIFAEVFIKALQNAEMDVFTAEELNTLYIRESVAGRTEQTPEYKILRNSGHDGGDFIFIKNRR